MTLWLTGSSPDATWARYPCKSWSRERSPRSEASCSVTRVERVSVVEWAMSRRRCSTPISSASSASIAEGQCKKVFRTSVPSCRSELNVFQRQRRDTRTSLISSTAKYASVGIPSCSGRTSTITITGRGMYRLKRSLISWSDARSLGPE